MVGYDLAKVARHKSPTNPGSNPGRRITNPFLVRKVLVNPKEHLYEEIQAGALKTGAFPCNYLSREFHFLLCCSKGARRMITAR